MYTSAQLSRTEKRKQRRELAGSGVQTPATAARNPAVLAWIRRSKEEKEGNTRERERDGARERRRRRAKEGGDFVGLRCGFAGYVAGSAGDGLVVRVGAHRRRGSVVVV